MEEQIDYFPIGWKTNSGHEELEHLIEHGSCNKSLLEASLEECVKLYNAHIYRVGQDKHQKPQPVYYHKVLADMPEETIAGLEPCIQTLQEITAGQTVAKERIAYASHVLLAGSESALKLASPSYW